MYDALPLILAAISLCCFTAASILRDRRMDREQAEREAMKRELERLTALHKPGGV